MQNLNPIQGLELQEKTSAKRFGNGDKKTIEPF